jgi:hypothetical protein
MYTLLNIVRVGDSRSAHEHAFWTIVRVQRCDSAPAVHTPVERSLELAVAPTFL